MPAVAGMTERDPSLPRRREPRVAGRRPSPSLHVQQQALRIFQAFLDADQEGHGLAAVDHPVVVAERQIHHRTDLDLVADRDRALLGLVHAQDARLRRVQDRGRHERAVDAAVRDGEGAAGQFFHRQLAVARLLAIDADLLLDVGEAHQVRIAHDRHHEAALGADRNTDVVVVLVDQLVARDLGIDRRQFLQGGDAGLHEEGHEAELHAVLLLERVLVLLADRQDRGHVHLVEGGQHGGGVLGFLEPLGDALTQARHPHALLARAGAGTAGAAGAAGPFSIAASTSPLVRRPSLPVAAMLAGSSWFSATSLRAAGPERSRSDAAAAGAAGAGAAAAGFGASTLAAGAAAAGAAAAPAAPSAITPRRPPTATLVPSGADISLSTPFAGDGTSTVTLSVSNSISVSSILTLSPTFFSQRATVPSVTDSPRGGTLISVAIFGPWFRFWVWRRCGVRPRRSAPAGFQRLIGFVRQPRVSASSITFCCWAICFLLEPVAVAADSARPM